jgi:hypothetical protein
MSDDRADQMLDSKREPVEAPRLSRPPAISRRWRYSADVREFERRVELQLTKAAGSAESETTMTDYRAYILGPDGHFKTVEVINAPDDEKAIETARQFVDGCSVEVWELDRKVVLLPTPE